MTDRAAEELKFKLQRLKPGEHVHLSLGDEEDGDEQWVFIPYGAPVIINMWDVEPVKFPPVTLPPRPPNPLTGR